MSIHSLIRKGKLVSVAPPVHHPILRQFLAPVARRLVRGILILLAIAFLTFVGLILAERGRAGLPAQLLDASVEALRRTVDYVFAHPPTYTWQRQETAALSLVLTLLGRSAALILLSLVIAAGIGVPFGIWITVRGHRRLAALALPLSVLGISTPSFLFAMILWIVNIQLGKWFGGGKAPLPTAGFGWDAHMFMPALVLAMRPLAQLVQITRVSLADVLGSDYVRTATSKGLSRSAVIRRHALRNVAIPILTTLGVSMRFSLATLPVVELFFVWPGLGSGLLQAISAEMPTLVVDLLVALGLLFLLVNGFLETLYQVIDPRVRDETGAEAWETGGLSWRQRQQMWIQSLKDAQDGLRRLVRRGLHRRSRQPAALPGSMPGSPQAPSDSAADTAGDPAATSGLRESVGRRRALLAGLTNPALLAGTVVVLGLVAAAIWGEGWAPGSAYTTHGVMKVDGVLRSPPFAPGITFPWGSDAIGRDVQALVLAGAKTTLTLALFATIARLILGAVLGLLAGWWRGGWLDRLIQAVIAVWAAFPVTLFAMILILALGIQQGLSVFVAALCIVGWGEVAQFVRGQVIGLKPQPYIEGARTVGARAGWVLTRHVLPHLWAPLLVMSALEMASVLMLLADLGFLNIFVGGGFRADIGQSAGMQTIVYYFSDVPEWSALLANIRNWWRSYPWLAWYPGVAFFLAILAFNLLGEGLRHFLEESRINIGRVINRYSAAAAAMIFVGAILLVRSATPLAVYSRQVEHYDAQRALADVSTLASRELAGRESGMPGARAAVDHIAGEMKAMGLLPAGDRETYIRTQLAPRPHLSAVPQLELLDSAGGEVALAFTYRQDYVEYTGYGLYIDEGDTATRRGPLPVVGIAIAAEGVESGSGYTQSLLDLPLEGQALLLHQADFVRLEEALQRSRTFERLSRLIGGILIVVEDPATLERRELFPSFMLRSLGNLPALMITPDVAERLLAGSNVSLAGLTELSAGLAPGKLAMTEPGARIAITFPVARANMDEAYLDVIGFIPGHDAMGGLDSHVIIVSAYYDGLGTGPDGTLFPGANDNASGVAAMLEIARAMQEAVQPRRTVLFVAWAGGERREGFSVKNTMSAKIGFNSLTVDAVIELSGMGAGTGKGLALGPNTSFSLVQLFQDAGRELGTSVTTRGRGPHFGMGDPVGFGGRSALSAYVSWDGADDNAHTPYDTIDAIDPEKLRRSGQTTLLVVSVLSQSTQ